MNLIIVLIIFIKNSISNFIVFEKFYNFLKFNFKLNNLLEFIQIVFNSKKLIRYLIL